MTLHTTLLTLSEEQGRRWIPINSNHVAYLDSGCGTPLGEQMVSGAWTDPPCSSLRVYFSLIMYYNLTSPTEEIIMRKIKEAFPRSRQELDDSIVVFCEDGTLWEFNGARWKELPEIPSNVKEDRVSAYGI